MCVGSSDCHLSPSRTQKPDDIRRFKTADFFRQERKRFRHCTCVAGRHSVVVAKEDSRMRPLLCRPDTQQAGHSSLIVSHKYPVVVETSRQRRPVLGRPVCPALPVGDMSYIQSRATPLQGGHRRFAVMHVEQQFHFRRFAPPLRPLPVRRPARHAESCTCTQRRFAAASSRSRSISSAKASA